MAVRLFSEFKSDLGILYLIEIHDTQWAAASTEFNVDSRGFELNYDGETDDIVSPIVGSKLTFGAYSENGTFETFVDLLKTFQENRFRVMTWKHNGTSYDLYWVGWIIQDLVNVEDESQPYVYNITAADGLGRLANIDYTANNNLAAGLTRVSNLLGNCIDFAGISDLWGAGDVYLETSVNWWETSVQTYATTKDTIEEHAIDILVFRDEDGDGNTTYSKAYDVLKELCITYGARIYQSNGRWIFEQYVNRANTPRIVSLYNKTITRLSTSSRADDITIDQTNGFARLTGAQFNFLPAVGSVSVEYARDKFNAISKPYTFKSTAPTKTLGIIGASTATQLKFYGPHNYNITSNTGVTTNDQFIAVVWRMQIRIESATTPGLFYYYNRAFNGFATAPVYGAAAWSTTAGYYYYHSPFAKVAFGAVSINAAPVVITSNLPTSGTLRITSEHYGNFLPLNGTAYTLAGHQTDTWSTTLTIVRMDNANDDSVSVTYRANNSNANVNSKIELQLGTTRIANGLFQTGDLSVYNGTTFVSGISFRRGPSGAGNQILNLLTMEMLGLHAIPVERFNGQFFSAANFDKRFIFDGGYWVNIGGRFTANNNQWSGEWFRIDYASANIGTISEIPLALTNAVNGGSNIANDDGVIEVGRVGGMVVNSSEERIGPYEQTGTGANISGTMSVTGDVTFEADLEVDGVSQFNNDVNITGSVISTGPLEGEYIQLDTTYNTTPIAGQIVWSTDDGTIDVGLNSNVVMQVGQEEFFYIKNQTGATITKGSAVRASGTLGASGRILGALMVADGSVAARFLLGIAAENIVNGGEGYVTTFGKIKELNTSAFTEGAVLWCNPAVAGGLTATEPSAPNLKLAVAFVIRSHATTGILAVRSEIGARISDSSDVQITSVADNDLLQYNTTTARWENIAGTTTNIAEGTNLYYTDTRSRAAISETIDGVSYNNTTGVFSLDANRVIVTTTQTNQWDTAYNDRIVSAAVTGTTSKTLTLTQGDAGTITATWSDYDTAPVTSVNGFTGVVVLTTTDIAEGTNLYYTDARARAAVSAGVGISYNNGTGVITNSAPDQVVALTASTAIAITGTYPNFTIANSAPDQVVALTAGTGVGVTGTYPTFTITNSAPDQVVALTASTAIAVTGTYPNFTIANSAPDQVVALTASTGISVTGTYPNFTITNTSPSSGGTITGSGTANYLSKFTGASAIGNSSIYDDGTNVGIGTASPSHKFHVQGSSVLATFRNSSTAADQYTQLEFIAGSRDAYIWLGNQNTTSWAGDGGLNIYTGTGNMDFWTAATQKMRLTASGNLGIGTTAPATKLHVEGGSDYNTTFSSSSGRSGWVITSPGTSTPRGSALVLSSDNSFRFGTASYYHIAMNVDGSTQIFNTSGSVATTFTAAGNVGIGTTSPATALHVIGEISVPSYIRLTDAGANNAFISESWGINLNGVTTHPVQVRGASFSVGYSLGAGASYGTNSMFVAGNVGIGTTAPGAQLEVASANTNAVVDIFNLYNPSQTSSGVRQRFRNGYGDLAAIKVSQRDNGALADDGQIEFQVASNSSLDTKLTILNTGNVGIGTTGPSLESSGIGLDILNSSYTQLRVRSSSSSAGIEFKPSTGDRWEIQANNSNEWFVYNRTDEQYRLLIDGTGNVGIGTTAPAYKLDVTSDIRIGEGLRMVPNAGAMYAVDGALSYYSSSNGVYLNGAGTNGWLRLNASGLENDINSINIYGQGAGGYIDVNTGNSTRIRVTNGGNVGIGITNPNSKMHINGKLTIGGDASSFVFGTLEYVDSTTGFVISAPGRNMEMETGWNEKLTLKTGSTGLVVSTNNGAGTNTTRLSITPSTAYFNVTGNVGIGTTSPNQKLSVEGGSIQLNANNAAANYYLFLNKKSGQDGGMLFNRDNASDWQLTNGAGNGDLIFYSYGTASEAITFKRATGNVGIGTTAPTAKLHVWNGGIKTSAFPSAGNPFTFLESNYNDSAVTIRFQNINPSNGLDADLGIQLMNTGGSISDVLRIKGSTGNVGIGTTAPSEKLHVDGNTILTYNNSFQGINSIGNKAILARVSPTSGIINYAEYATAANLNGFVIGSTDARVKGNITGDSLEFITNASTRVTILSGGNVGIGTTSPANILHITDVMRMDNVAGNAPAVQMVSPVYAYGDPENNRYLADPAIWLRINVGGTEYVIPAYTQA